PSVLSPLLRPPLPPLFPYTTLFRSAVRAHTLFTSPLGGLDAADVRAVSRALRAREKEAALAEGRPARPSAELLRAAIIEPALLRSEEHTSELQSRENLVCRLLLGKT